MLLQAYKPGIDSPSLTVQDIFNPGFWVTEQRWQRPEWHKASVGNFTAESAQTTCTHSYTIPACISEVERALAMLVTQNAK